MKIAQISSTAAIILFYVSPIYAKTTPSYLNLSQYNDFVRQIENIDFNPPTKNLNNNINNMKYSTKESGFYFGDNATAAIILFYESPIRAKTSPSYLNLSQYNDFVRQIESTAFNPPTKNLNNNSNNMKYSTSESGFYFGGGAGVTYSNPGQNQIDVNTYYVQEEGEGPPPPTLVTWIKEHVKNPRGNFGFLLNFGGGYEFALRNDCFFDLGIALYMEHQYSTSGASYATLYGEGNYEYNYSYNITSFIQSMVEAKFKIKINRFLPFVSFGVGPSWIKSESYTLMPVGVQEGYETLTYPSDRKTRLAYQIGCGIEYQISNNNFLALEYKCIYLGKIDFKIQNEEYPYKLHVGNIWTHNVMLNFIHRF